MAPSFKPKGYTSVAPYLMVTGAPKVIDFLKQTLGATAQRRFDMPDGTIMHVELKIDDTIVMMAEGSAAWPAFPTWLHVYVPDVDATYQRALAAGGTTVQPPEQKQGDPDRRGGVKDPSGNTWWFSTQVG